MHFKHPEILYALLLLLIPILVHLFQLQRFVKVPFTNVKFLKAIEKQTRKSARLKKLLVLITRMLLFTCLIFAFAQPYFSEYYQQQNFSTTIYLDNSFSMQAKGETGELLKSAAKNIIENNTISENKITFITNSHFLKDIDNKNLKNLLTKLNYYPNKLDLNTVLLKAQQGSNDNSIHKTVIISDFQSVNLSNNNFGGTSNNSTSILKLNPKKINNFYIDSLFVIDETTLETNIKVILKSSLKNDLKIPISLFNDSKLISKTTASFNNSNVSSVEFKLPNAKNFNGKITLVDNALEFDNDFYFSISKPEKIKVLCIGEASNFLSKIYTKDAFNFKESLPKNLNYNELQNQHLIVLNELENIPKELINHIETFIKLGGHIAVIPSKNIDYNSYNNLLRIGNIGEILTKKEIEHNVTSINYDHPIVKDVFEKKVTNFQYPKVNLYYPTNLNNSSAIIKLDNNDAFISSIEYLNSSIYWVSSPLDKESTNFSQSPLIVPVFYNMASHSLKTGHLYNIISSENKVEISTSIKKDEVLKISNNNLVFIPLQKSTQNKVSLNLENNIVRSGFYKIFKNTSHIKTLAFNYNREESDLQYLNLNTLTNKYPNLKISSSIEEVFNEINNQQKINWLFKWFLAFSVLFLLIEMLILKYFNK